MIHLEHRPAAQRDVPHVFDDADDAKPRPRVEAGSEAQATVDRVLAGPVPLCHRAVDDRHALGAAVVRR